MITHYVPTTVGPSKLDLTLAYCPELSDQSKTKVIVITDIARLYKLLGGPALSPANFYALYELDELVLGVVQHNAQIEWNTKQYYNSVQGHDF